MPSKKHRFPQFVTLIGRGTEIVGEVRFVGGLHVDGRVVGDVIATEAEGCAVSLSASGVIEGNLDVPHAVLDGTVIGDVRAHLRAELAPGARIQGALYYGLLEMDEGAEVNGKLVRVDGESDGPPTVAAPQASDDARPSWRGEELPGTVDASGRSEAKG